MKALFILFSILSFLGSNAEIIRFKFLLFNKIDSSKISLTQVHLTPVTSYYVQESEHHDDSGSHVFGTGFKFYNIYYDAKEQINIFEYDTKEYKYKEMFLRVQSDSFFYFRRTSWDYDEYNCIRFKTNEVQAVQSVFLSPCKYLQILASSEQHETDCIQLTVSPIDKNGDTSTWYSPSFTKKSNSSKMPAGLIKTIAFIDNQPFLLLIELYNRKEYRYAYYKFAPTNKNIQYVDLKDLVFQKTPTDFDCSGCTRLSKYKKRNKHVIDYHISDGYD